MSSPEGAKEDELEMIGKQTKVLFFLGLICLAIALIWQSYSRIAFEHSRQSAAMVKTEDGGSWDPGQLYVHHPPLSNVLLLVGAAGLLLSIHSLIGDRRRRRR